jgi:hypothetical protein
MLMSDGSAPAMMMLKTAIVTRMSIRVKPARDGVLDVVISLLCVRDEGFIIPFSSSPRFVDA